MQDEKVIVRCKDRSLLKGSTYDFDPGQTFFHIKLLTGRRIKMMTEAVKALFIVKDYNGNKEYKYLYKDTLIWGGIKIKITFTDNEVMIGYVPYHISGAPGFFVTPADLGGNNERVFAVKSAIREIMYL